MTAFGFAAREDAQRSAASGATQVFHSMHELRVLLALDEVVKLS
jgi:hypothetical protein